MPAVYLLAVQVLNGLSGFVVVGHFNKAETFAVSRFFVGDDLGGSYFSVLFKYVAQFGFVNGVVEVSDVDVHNTKIEALGRDK
jgi:hypothetical protein